MGVLEFQIHYKAKKNLINIKPRHPLRGLIFTLLDFWRGGYYQTGSIKNRAHHGTIWLNRNSGDGGAYRYSSYLTSTVETSVVYPSSTAWGGDGRAIRCATKTGN